ncbi:MAG: tautomerase family protein [Rhodospirillaceae bacterium]
MPIAQLYIAEGRSEAQKKQLIEKVTQAFVDALGTPADSVWITVQDVPKTQWGIGGKTLADRSK